MGQKLYKSSDPYDLNQLSVQLISLNYLANIWCLSPRLHSVLAHLAFSAIVCRSVLVTDADKFLRDRMQQVQGRLDLSLGVGGLHCRAHYGDVISRCCRVVCIGDHADVDV